MKNIKLSLVAILMLFAGVAMAQKPANAYVSPAAFTMDEEATLYVDLTGTAVENLAEDLFIWSWSNGDAAYNGQWGGSDDRMKLTQVEGALYMIKFVASEWYPTGLTDNAINFLVKNRDGSAQTDNIDGDDAIKTFDFSIMENEKAVIFPEKFDAYTPVSIIINVRNAVADGKPNIPDEGPVYIHTGAILGKDGWKYTVDYQGNPAAEASSLEKRDASMVKVNDSGVWKKDIIPFEYYGLSEEDAASFKGVSMVANNGAWDNEFKDGDTDFFLRTKEDVVLKSFTKAFPVQFTENDAVLIYFDVFEEFGGKTPLAVESQVYVQFVVDGTDFEMPKEMQALYGGKYRLAFIPSKAFDTVPSSLEYYFTNENKTSTVRVVTADGIEQNFTLGLVK
ncbi:hypothetical protein V6R21_21785 [Limibacter armeniacum]|uniref:hypothetical protein n=1 Tax=Limibacter armeniacum TaxID=466084 RepID=UPI002FE57DE4